MDLNMLGLAIAILGGALAVGLAGSGSAIGVALAGSAASGLIAEDPEKFGATLLLVALPGTQGIYGFLTGFLVIMKLGLLSATVIKPSLFQGIQIFGACMPIAIAGFISAVHQGKVCAAGIGVAAKKPEAAMKALVYGALVETYAILGLVMSIFFLQGIKLQ
ncbi:MAG: V-type ATP synthase subunit K [Candidatus Omnitrophota bacterium]